MERVWFTSMIPEDTVERLRVHGRLLTGYALALAERSGLDPTEAADLFILPLLSGAPPLDDVADPGAIQRWLDLEAAAMEAVHGHVELRRDGTGWQLVISAADDLSWLRLWDVSPTYWVAWLEGHLGRVARRHGMVATVTLEDDELHLTFGPVDRLSDLDNRQ